MGRVAVRNGRACTDSNGRVYLDCCPGASAPTVGVPCCANPISTILCVALSDPGGCFSGVTFPIFHASTYGFDANCPADSWTALGTPPGLAGCTAWGIDNDEPSLGVNCGGGFYVECYESFGLRFWRVVSSSTNFCNLGTVASPTAESCDPFQLTFDMTVSDVSGCTGTIGRTVTATVTECNETPLVYLDACGTAGLPLQLNAVFTLTSGSDTGCGLDGFSIPMDYVGCGGTVSSSYCTLYTGTIAGTVTVGGTPTAGTWEATLSRNVSTGAFRLQVTFSTPTLICFNSTHAAATLDSCSPIQLSFPTFQFLAGGSCPCNSAAATYSVTVL